MPRKGANSGANHLAPNTYQPAPVCTEDGSTSNGEVSRTDRPKALPGGAFRTELHESASICTVQPTPEEKVRPAGFEPANLGSEDGRPIDVTGKPVAPLRQSENGEVPTVVPSPPNRDFGPQLPVDLVELIAAWNTLPEAVRAGMLAMVRATREQGHAGT